MWNQEDQVMKRMCFLSLALAAALTVGCRGDNRDARTTNPETGAPVGTSGARDISRGDQDFVKDATIVGMAEGAAGWWLDERRPLDATELADELAGLAWKGFARFPSGVREPDAGVEPPRPA